MDKGIHFISGLPRSGSTLLSALLLQNPALQAGITSPVGSLVGALLRDVSAGNETSVFVDDGQREALLRGVARRVQCHSACIAVRKGPVPVLHHPPGNGVVARPLFQMFLQSS